jgi:aminopeptidase N
VTAHEAAHSWYQHLLATNEAQYPWMDEGFTSYAADIVMAEIWPKFTPFVRSYGSYYSLINSGKQEPLTTHADHYHTNRAYGVASYSMGLIFVRQLGYVVGEDVLHRSLKRYFHEWKYKHPTPNDFIRVVEKVSGMELSWYLEQWMETTNTIDYGLRSVEPNGNNTVVRLEQNGTMPMPVDVLVKYKNGNEAWFNIPLRIMRSEKKAENEMESYTVIEDWPWTFPAYEFTLETKFEEIESIEIDPSGRMADKNRFNNQWPLPDDAVFEVN